MFTVGASTAGMGSMFQCFDHSACKAVFPDVKVHMLFLELQAMTPEVNIVIFHLEQLGFVHITEAVYHVSSQPSIC